MEIEFLGVGEAFDPALGNTSVLVRENSTLLVDCGYAVPLPLFERGYTKDTIDAVYLTHFHGDHILGIPALIVRAHEEKRQKPLTFLGQPGLREAVTGLVERAYPRILAKLHFPLEFVEGDAPTQFNELSLSFAETAHSLRNLAVRVESGGKAVGISGDGRMTPASQKLFLDCDLVIHEAYRFETEAEGHGTATAVIDALRPSTRLKHLAFVHVQRDERRLRGGDFAIEKTGGRFTTWLPTPGER